MICCSLCCLFGLRVLHSIYQSGFLVCFGQVSFHLKDLLKLVPKISSISWFAIESWKVKLEMEFLVWMSLNGRNGCFLHLLFSQSRGESSKLSSQFISEVHTVTWMSLKGSVFFLNYLNPTLSSLSYDCISGMSSLSRSGISSGSPWREMPSVSRFRAHSRAL